VLDDRSAKASRSRCPESLAFQLSEGLAVPAVRTEREASAERNRCERQVLQKVREQSLAAEQREEKEKTAKLVKNNLVALRSSRSSRSLA